MTEWHHIVIIDNFSRIYIDGKQIEEEEFWRLWFEWFPRKEIEDD